MIVSPVIYYRSIFRSPLLRLLNACINRHDSRKINNSIYGLLRSKESLLFGHQPFCKIQSDEVVICYTDGSCINNGKSNTVAGIGVFWGEDHQDNLSISLGIGQHTNNKTEILAIIHALEIAIQRGYKNVIIRTDSELIVKSMNNWVTSWKANNWRKANNQPVKNCDLIKRIDDLCTQIGNVSFEHIKGSTNKNAHYLASIAMSKGKAELLSF